MAFHRFGDIGPRTLRNQSTRGMIGHAPKRLDIMALRRVVEYECCFDLSLFNKGSSLVGTSHHLKVRILIGLL